MEKYSFKSFLKLSGQEGQSLIVLVLMISIILAIVSATSYRLTTETQVTELQEESVRALAAADTGIEVGLQQANTAPINTYTYNQLNLTSSILPGIDTARSQVIVTNTGNSFVTPIISKDSQFTFYVKDYADSAAPNYNSDLSINFRSEAVGSTCATPRNQPAYEITYIYGPTNNFVRRALIEPCTGANAISGNSFTPLSPGGPFTVNSVSFEHNIILNPATAGMADLRLIIIRPIFGSARFGFTGANLPTQGKNIQATAYTISGPSKVVTVYQSLPQIPAEFFVTTF